MSLWVFVARRLLFSALVLLMVSMVVFVVVQVLPGDVASMILGTDATPEDVATMREKLGLNRPAHVRYLEWIAGAVQGDWGTSLRLNQPVAPLIMTRMGNSAVLAGLTLLVAVPLAIGLGVYAGLRRGRLPDRIIALVTLIGTSLPEFVWGNLLIIVFAFWFKWLPPSSLMDPGDPVFAQFKLLILPVATLTMVMLAYTSRMTRTSMIEVLEKNFIRTARLKGIGERQVILRHALPNALLPTITIVAMNIGWLMGSLVVVETVFSFPGLGRMMVFAVSNRDVPMLQMTVLVTAAIYCLANLLADVLYAYMNPRVRY
ncbi:MAG: ABC transporter permease [Betaproteobacteria bacterium]|nr:ABC transporter permease [Betaproteobacteria bacterium]MBK9607464.1 ABC transporter permease [Betaproteobacteria bacterium]